jgi:hypothetical protein
MERETKGSLPRAASIHPGTIDRLRYALSRVIAVGDIAAPAVYLLLSAGDDLLLAENLKTASFRQAKLLEHLLLGNTLGKQFLKTLM